jgi:hypothetical protein
MRVFEVGEFQRRSTHPVLRTPLPRGNFNELLVHRLICGDGGWGLSGEVAEDPVFEDGVDQDREGSDEEGVEFTVFRNTEMLRGA